MNLGRHARQRLYVIIPVAAFVLVFANMLYGNAVFSSIHPESIEKYSIYVHFVDGWDSYPGNILFEVTNVWNSDLAEITYFSTDDFESIPYGSNQLQHAGDRSFVALHHHHSNCQSSWQPILYRYVLDVLRNQFEAPPGMYGVHPYAVMYPDLPHAIDRPEYGYVQFIPLCTLQDTTSYAYSIKSNDPDLAFDAFFVADRSEHAKFLRDPSSIIAYAGEECNAISHLSYSGRCSNVSSKAGLLVWIPDSLDLSLTKITVNLREL